MATTSEYLTQLQNDKQDLVDNLNTKGVEASDDETFTSLVPKVLDIPSGGGDYNAQMNIEYEGTFTTSKGISSLLTVVPTINTTGKENLIYLFYNCSSLINAPLLDTSSATSMNSMFYGCSSLINVPSYDTSSVTNMSSIFNRCSSLINAPQFDTSKVVQFGSAFYECSSLITVPQFDTSNVINMSSMFYFCNSLTSLPLFDASKVVVINNIFNGCYNLIDLGGFQNLGQAYLTTASANYNNYKLDLSPCSKLTHDSLMNVINNLYDIAAKGCNTQQLVLGNVNKAKLTEEEIAIATNKGWTVV